MEHCIERLEEGQDLNGLEIETGNAKECESRPMSKGKALLTSASCSRDLIPGLRAYKSARLKLSRPRLLGEGVSLEGVGARVGLSSN